MTVSAVTPSLRPLGAGELLDRTVRIYRRHFFKFIGIVALVQVPYMLIALVYSLGTLGMAATLQYEPDSLQSLGGLLAGFSGLSILITIAGVVLIQGLGTAAMTRAVVDDVMGTPSGVLGTYARLGKSWMTMIRAAILVLLITLLLVVIAIVPCVGWVVGPGMLVMTSMLLLPLAAPVVVVEGGRARRALRRVWDLVRRRFWPVFGFALALYTFIAVITYGPTFLVSWGLTALLSSTLGYTQLQIVSSVSQSFTTMLLSLITLPLTYIAITVLYFDLRVRTEGLDLALQMSEAELGGQSDLAAVLAAEAPPASQSTLVTGAEIGYFALIGVGILALYGIFIGVVMVITMLTMGAMGF